MPDRDPTMRDVREYFAEDPDTAERLEEIEARAGSADVCGSDVLWLLDQLKLARAGSREEVELAGVDWISTPTFYATIWLATQKGVDTTGETVSLAEVHRATHEYCAPRKICVTITPTSYIYSEAQQPGVAVRLVAYPKRPRTLEEIEMQACGLAEWLRVACSQLGVMVETPLRVLWRSVEEPWKNKGTHEDPRSTRGHPGDQR